MGLCFAHEHAVVDDHHRWPHIEANDFGWGVV
jgi:hypothetical protein